ncbi:Nn.00g057280.m01.CDS01 [Neocucurbitaria sp. VM-36]
MPAYLQRLKRSLRCHSYFASANSITPPTKETKTKHQTNEYDDDLEVLGDRRRRPPSPLPEITDAGPPTTGRYANDDIYWNSSMTEADVDPVKTRTSARQNTKSQKPMKAAEVKAWKNVPSHGQDLEPVREEISSRTPEVSNTRKQQRNQSGDEELARETGLGSDRVGKDFIVMLAYPPVYTEQLPTPTSLPRDPITPGTKEYDAFMDYPSQNSMHIYRDDGGPRHILLPVHDKTTTANTATKPTVHHEGLQHPNEHLPLFTVPSGRLDHEQSGQNGEELTWTLVLNHILASPAVDPVMKQAVQDRVQSSSTTNGFRDKGNPFVSTQEAGLVPNFSYPIAGSAFYERSAAEQIPQESLLSRARAKEANGEGEKVEQLTNGVTLGSSDSEDSTDSSHDTLYRAPTPLDEAPGRVHSLLSSILTPSELSLHYRIVNGASPDISSNSLTVTTPVSSTESPAPRRARLIRNLHTIILGLQDRISGLEDSLVPQLSTWLEKKSVTIDELSVEVRRSQDKISNLKYMVDFGNKVLGGCWDRESELWFTVTDIQRRRRTKANALFRRLMWRLRDQRQRNADRCDGNLPGDCGRQNLQHQSSNYHFPRTAEGNIALSNRELDALVTITAQNVRILGEDIEDMVTLVQDCKRMASGMQEIERPKEGSWRDV